MRARLYILVSSIIGFSVLMALSLAFHWGGDQGFPSVEREVLALSFLLGGVFTLIVVHLRPQPTENMEPWFKHERLAWSLIATSFLFWTIGGYIFLYFQAIGQVSGFSWTSVAVNVLCFVGAFLLNFLGLLFLPSSATGSRRVLVLLDSLISTGSLFAIGWFLLLGPLTLAPGKDLTVRIQTVYAPTVDVLTISYILYLLLSTFAFSDHPGHRTASKQRDLSASQRISLLILSLGLITFGVVDFTVNIRLSLGTFHGNASWSDLGWAMAPMMTGLAAYLRRFLPATMNGEHTQQERRPTLHLHLEAIQFAPYLLAMFPMLALIFNALSPQPVQRDIRPVLTIVTLLVIALVLIRQIITMNKNEQLILEQVMTMEQLERTSSELAHNASLRAEFNVAAKIQTQLLPRQLPTVQGLDLFAHSTPMEQVGGDFYDVFSQQDAPFVFVLGDISGHGLPAALLMTMTRTVFHTATHSLALIDPRVILMRTNEDLYEDFTEVGMFVTVFVGCYDVRSARLLYANAGHSPVIYCPWGGSATLLEANAPVLGILPTTSFINEVVPFHKGDVLLVGTDGLNESFNPQGEMFGYERLLKAVETLAHLPAREIGMKLLSTIEQFTQGQQRSDDRTLLVLKGAATSFPT